MDVVGSRENTPVADAGGVEHHYEVGVATNTVTTELENLARASRKFLEVCV